MDRRSEQKRIQKIRARVESILAKRGVELDLGPHPNSIRNQHKEYYLWLIVEALALAIDRQPTITAEDLEAVEGVGPATAERIIESLQQ